VIGQEHQDLIVFLVVVFHPAEKAFHPRLRQFIEEDHLIPPDSLPLRDLALLHYRIVGVIL